MQCSFHAHLLILLDGRPVLRHVPEICNERLTCLRYLPEALSNFSIHSDEGACCERTLKPLRRFSIRYQVVMAPAAITPTHANVTFVMQPLRNCGAWDVGKLCLNGLSAG